MIKLVALVQRKTGLSSLQFRDYWIGVHAPLARQIPGMLGYRINIAANSGDLAGAPYDGSAEIWFADRDNMNVALSSPEGATAGADTANFARSVTFLVTQEHVIVPGDGRAP